MFIQDAFLHLLWYNLELMKNCEKNLLMEAMSLALALLKVIENLDRIMFFLLKIDRFKAKDWKVQGVQTIFFWEGWQGKVFRLKSILHLQHVQICTQMINSKWAYHLYFYAQSYTFMFDMQFFLNLEATLFLISCSWHRVSFLSEKVRISF